MRCDPPDIEWQDGQLGRRAANEAVDEQEVLRLLGSQRVAGTFAGGTARREPGFDLDPRPGLRRQRANGETAPPLTKNAFCSPGSIAGAIR